LLLIAESASFIHQLSFATAEANGPAAQCLAQALAPLVAGQGLTGLPFSARQQMRRFVMHASPQMLQDLLLIQSLEPDAAIKADWLASENDDDAMFAPETPPAVRTALDQCMQALRS